MEIYFSESSGFIPAKWKEDGTYRQWPADAVLLTDAEQDKYHRKSPPHGKALGAIDGRPAWVSSGPVYAVAPAAVSRFQARAALHKAGRLAEVEAAIADADVITQMAWQDAQEFRRNSPTILALGAQLGLDLDALFIAAAQIQA